MIEYTPTDNDFTEMEIVQLTSGLQDLAIKVATEPQAYDPYFNLLLSIEKAINLAKDAIIAAEWVRQGNADEITMAAKLKGRMPKPFSKF